jgi:hypothetical protein
MTIVAPALFAPTILRDPADDAGLAAAVGAVVDLIVSGDAHLLNLKSFQGIDIVTAANCERPYPSCGVSRFPPDELIRHGRASWYATICVDIRNTFGRL